jgi:tight adherence protein C
MLHSIAVFLVVAACFYYSALWFVRGKKNRDVEVLAGGKRRPLVFGSATAALAGVIPATAKRKANITRELQQAGYYHRLACEEFAAIRNVLVIGWILFIGTLTVVMDEPGTRWTPVLLLVGLVGVLLLYSLPRLALRNWAGGRVQRIQYAMPDALDMITMCMTGGLPLRQALTRVGEELSGTHPDLACELRIVSRQTDAHSLGGAMERFADRINKPDVQSLAVMVAQTGQQGTSIAAAFQEHADGLRRERRQRAEEHGNKTTVKLLLPLVFCLAPPVYLLLLTPAVMELRSFVRQENLPGGVLSPVSLIDEDGTFNTTPQDFDSNADAR